MALRSNQPTLNCGYRNCPIMSVEPYGVQVEVLPGVLGMIHISELDINRVSYSSS
jgi:hypothetical protein